MIPTLFKVSHQNNACLGIAKILGKRVSYTANPKEYAWFEERPESWLRDFQSIVRRLCRSTGHCGKFAITTDEDSGITVERL